MELTFYTFPKLDKELEDFLSKYTIERIVGCPSEKINNQKPKKDRICRFCGLSSPKTKFKKEAHIIPHLLGNRYLVSDFECDNCNSSFSAFENDLANFLGVSRTIHGVKAKENIPSFKSYDKFLEAKRTDFFGIKDGTQLKLSKSDKTKFEINEKEGKTTITYFKQPYKPIKVYKALLKIALAILPEKYLIEYGFAFKLLLSNELDNNLKDFAKVFYYQIYENGGVTQPVCFLFKKIDPTLKSITHIFSLYYQNHIYQFPLPLNKKDIELGLYNGEQYSFPMCPPLLSLPPKFDASYKRRLINLSSTQILKEEEVISFNFTPGTISNSKSIDLANGETKNDLFNPDEIIGIYIAPRGSKLTFPNQSKD